MDEDAGEFGDRLRACRRASGLSQQELAERSGLSVRAVSKLECGRTRWPYPDSVHRLAAALGLRDAERGAFVAAAERRLARGSEPAGPRAAAQACVPRQVPAPVPAFTGRAAELEVLARTTGTAGGAALVTAITGTAGGGKTALAVHWAHEAAAEFPDGQIFVNLRGFGPAGAPLTSADAARVYLDALGVHADRLPATAEAQLGLYRSLVAGKRLLIVLDNARDAPQVRPLLPGSQGCRVIVTSRDQLRGLTVTQAARPLTLHALTSTEARRLLAVRLGSGRLGTDRHAVDQIISACAGLPLALCIIAARAELRPELPLARIATELAARPGLDAFTDPGDPAADIRAAFSWSYRQLDSDAARGFRLAGLHPDLELEPRTLAALSGTTTELAGRALDTLARGSLVQPVSHERYTMNRLLRAYARELAVRHEEAANRTAVTARFARHDFTRHAAEQRSAPLPLC
jgi:transcriptional regulator with XRE-family HTH domain